MPEVRNAIDNYNETSPLYGFLHYRRRKVILRYMPDGLSRLILGTAWPVVRRDVKDRSIINQRPFLFSPE